MKRFAACVGFGAVLLAGCQPNVCDKSAQFDPATKVGDCAVQVPSRVLAAKDACNDALGSCSDAERKILEGVVSCWENLPVCAAASQQGWVDQSNGCYAGASGLSEACRAAAFGGGPLPGQDGGDGDGGMDGDVDAGPKPDTDGSGALNMVTTSNETTVAMAWVREQPGAVDHWTVYRFTAADLGEEPVDVTPPELMSFQEEVGMGVKKKYYVYGYNAANEVAYTQLQTDGGTDGGTDAGADAGVMCQDPLDCSPEQVCNLGACQTLPCTNSNVCPAGYLCDTVNDMRCERTFGFDAGTIDAGTEDAGTNLKERPFISEQVEIFTQASNFSPDRAVGGFAAQNIDLVAIDTARQFMVMEQDKQVFGYFTQDRGQSFRIIPMDTIGTHPKVTFEPVTRTLYACYNALGGIRVRVSTDYGRTWRNKALDIVNAAPDDGGTAALISDCDIAPWRDGQALVAAIEGNETVKVWAVTRDLELAVADPSVVFSSTGGTYFSPEDVAIATLPSDFVVHAVFSVKRPFSGATDTEILGMYRDGTTNGAFVGPVALHNTPNGFPQSAPTVAIDPVTKRGIAAYVSNETASGQTQEETVYVSMWMPATKRWATGSDLNIFINDNAARAYEVMTERQPGELWAARAPSISVSPAGKITLAVAAGKVEGTSPTLKVWSVPFDYEVTNPHLPGSAKGWFVPPAVKVSDVRVARLASGEVAGPIVVHDQQISTYYGFVQGLGTTGNVPNLPYVVSKPE